MDILLRHFPRYARHANGKAFYKAHDEYTGNDYFIVLNNNTVHALTSSLKRNGTAHISVYYTGRDVNFGTRRIRDEHMTYGRMRFTSTKRINENKLKYPEQYI